jgi:4-amino-4-deoxy-L-arabinose transferase-like glycosyltransferase
MVGQETLFQFFFIVSCYYFYKFYNKNKTKYLIAFSVFISLAILTKTIANLVFILMIISLIIFSKKKIYNSLIIILVILLVTFPYGFYNLKKNRFYVLSSTGSGLFFSMSHNDNIYNFLVEINSLGELKNKETINFYPQSYFNESLKYMSLKEKERYWFNEGMEWINDHPIKFIKMKIYNFFHFLFPGVNINHYSFSKWLISFTIALPLYFGAYISILKCLKSNFRKHLIIISTFGGMGIFSTFLMPVDRFIYITLEPILIVYFAHFIKELLFKNSYGFINQKKY